MADGAGRHCVDRAISEAISGAVDLAELAEARDSLWRAVGRLMERAKAQGRMDPDAQPADLRVLWAGVARVLIADGVDDPAEWRRYAALVLNALRSGG
jgi:hypothetical protein